MGCIGLKNTPNSFLYKLSIYLAIFCARKQLLIVKLMQVCWYVNVTYCIVLKIEGEQSEVDIPKWEKQQLQQLSYLYVIVLLWSSDLRKH